MLVSRLAECAEFVAGDSTRLRELLHPEKHPVEFRYSLAHALLAQGKTSIRHRLSVSEVYYILEGQGRMQIDGEERIVAAGDAVYIPPHATQCIQNVGSGDLRFLCIVDPAWCPEREEVEAEPLPPG